MSERFTLAANVLLKRRLNNLVRIDHQTEIDRDFITCAEYQLFIDEMRQQGENRQPDHWTSEKFSDGDAKKPVTGVRRSDAEEFCEWLTKRDSLPDFSYKLPTRDQLKEISFLYQNIGCWCKNNNAFSISGITAQQWQNWQQKLSKYFVFQDKNNIVKLDLDLDLDLDIGLALDLGLDPDLALDLDFDLYLDLYRNLDLFLYDQDIFLNLDLYRNLYLDLFRNLYLDLYRNPNLYLDFFQNLYLDLFQTRNLYLNQDLFLLRNLPPYQEITANIISKFVVLSFPPMTLILFYQSAIRIYNEAFRNKKIRKKFKLSRQECKQKSQEYTEKKDNIFKLYTYLVLMDQRQKGNMPAWEGIRIVRERKETE